MTDDIIDIEAESREEYAKQMERLESERREELEDIRWLLKHRGGQRFLRRVFDQFGLFVNAKDTNNDSTNFKLGQQSVTQWLFQEVTMACTKSQLSDLLFIDGEEKKKEK